MGPMLALCIETLSGSYAPRYMACTALDGRGGKLALGLSYGGVTWDIASPAVELFVEADGRLHVQRRSEAPPVTLVRAGRALSIAAEESVALLGLDELEVSWERREAKASGEVEIVPCTWRLRVHVHGPAESAHAPLPVVSPSSSPSREALEFRPSPPAVALPPELRSSPSPPPPVRPPRGSGLIAASAVIGALATLALTPLDLIEIAKATSAHDRGFALLLVAVLVALVASTTAKGIVAGAVRARRSWARGGATALLVVSAIGIPGVVAVLGVLFAAVLKYGAQGQEAMLAITVAAASAIALLLVAEILALVGTARSRRELSLDRADRGRP
jgi:hypothetical protein